MTYDQFVESTGNGAPPGDLSPLLLSLWLERTGDWDRAHTIAQSIPSKEGSAVHAYLHRVEGDPGNARYWYGRADREPFPGDEHEEWSALVREFL